MSKKSRAQSNAPSASNTITLTAPVSDTLTPQEIKDRQDAAEVEQKIEAMRAGDKIGEVEEIDYAPCAFKQSPSQCFGGQVIIDYGGTEKLPDYIFSRWYFGKKIIIDTFTSEEKYISADVEGRRKMAHKYGFKYAALGPGHSRYPLKDAQLRKQFPSMIEQLNEA